MRSAIVAASFLAACNFSGGGGEVPADATSDAVAPVTCTVAPPPDELTVATTRGLVRGRREGEVTVFRGIPFAAPPIGALRFQPPQQPDCWDSVLDTTAFGAKCPQSGLGDGHDGNENCLFLNVWTPALADQRRRPVVFWIHGGAQIAGAASDEIGPLNYNGQALADANDVVVVSTNYRLGALGFLTHPALDAESPHGASGNYALLDIISALHWVQANIERFGGDPQRVLVFGESAGAWNTCAIVASPLGAGLFSAALMQSGVCEAPTKAHRQLGGASWATTLGCDASADVAACLRDASVDALVGLTKLDLSAPVTYDLAHLSDLPAGPNVDGWVLPLSPRHALAAGTHNHVPLVIGTTAHEFDTFMIPGQIASCAAYQQRIHDELDPSVADAVLAEYPCPGFWAAQDTYSDVITDMTFLCPARRAARAARGGQSEPVYRYLYTHRRQLGPFTGRRAGHAMEIPLVFHTLGTLRDPATPTELALADRIGRYWTRLAATGDPNGAGDPSWSPYAASGNNALLLQPETAMSEGTRTEHCDFWDALLPP